MDAQKPVESNKENTSYRAKIWLGNDFRKRVWAQKPMPMGRAVGA